MPRRPAGSSYPYRTMTDVDGDRARTALAAGDGDHWLLAVRVKPDLGHFRRPTRGRVVSVRAQRPAGDPAAEYVDVAVAGDVLPFTPAELEVDRFPPAEPRPARSEPPAPTTLF